MSFRQSYKGIFQFKDQTALERAMAENQAEAMGADALGLQDCYHGEGVMLIDLDTSASLQDWEEMSVALATLAMHASKGFLYAIAFDGGETGPRNEYYEANAAEAVPIPVHGGVPEPQDDYFALNAGATLRYNVMAAGVPQGDIQWTVRKVDSHDTTYYFFEDTEKVHIHYNDFWDGTYFHKDGSLVEAVMAGNARELDELDPADPYARQVAYNNDGKPGDRIYTIWKDGDHFLVFTQEDFCDLELPYGTLAQCMKIRMDLYHVMGAEMYRETQVQYFAKGLGLVKWEKGNASLELVSYRP